MRIDHDLLARTRIVDTSRDCFNPFPATLRRWRNLRELDGRIVIVFLAVTTLKCKAEGQDKQFSRKAEGALRGIHDRMEIPFLRVTNFACVSMTRWKSSREFRPISAAECRRPHISKVPPT